MSGVESPVDESVLEPVADEPARTKLVYAWLHDHGPASVSAIAAGTWCPYRTTVRAVCDLRDAGLVSCRVGLEDARERIYDVADAPGD